MHFVFYPRHEFGCPHVGHCPHLGGASLGWLVQAADEQTEWTDSLLRQIDALRAEGTAKYHKIQERTASRGLDRWPACGDLLSSRGGTLSEVSAMGAVGRSGGIASRHDWAASAVGRFVSALRHRSDHAEGRADRGGTGGDGVHSRRAVAIQCRDCTKCPSLGGRRGGETGESCCLQKPTPRARSSTR